MWKSNWELRSAPSVADISRILSGVNMAQAAGQNSGDNGRAKYKEVLVRHHDLEQNKDKAQGTLVSILFMTQITELKMLLDIGRQGHRFYDFVLSLLIASIAMLIFVGMLIMYIGNIRYNRERKRGGWRERLKFCLMCRCRIKCLCCRRTKRRKRAESYICVPIGLGAPDPTDSDSHASDTSSDSEKEIGGCCRCRWPNQGRGTPSGDIDKLDSEIEASRVKLSNSVVKIVKATNTIEELEDTLKKKPRDADVENDLRRARSELQLVRRDKEQAESEQQLGESQRQHAYLVKDQEEEKEEKRTFKTVTFWQHLTTYLLYFICLMNIFITAFGIYGGRSSGEQGDH